MIPDSLRQLDPNVVGYGSIVAIGAMLLVIWGIARRIVALGYFLLFFFIGFAVVYGASAYSAKSPQVPLSIPIVGGLAFSAVASAIRARLMRIVSAAMLVVLFSLAGRFWSQYTATREPGGEQSVEAEHRRLAQEGLTTVKREFGDLVGLLPKKDGKIAPGFVDPKQLRRAGIDPKLEKVDQRPAWHTWLTGLYDQEIEELGIWTPGGTPETARKGLTLKPKP